jgi:hypothetical protein
MSMIAMPAVAETVPLQWDGASTSLEFFYYLEEKTGDSFESSCPKTTPIVTLSWAPGTESAQAQINGSSSKWQPLWNSSGSWADSNQWIGVRVPLPAAATALPQSSFAFRWENTEPGTGMMVNYCAIVYLDDITFPAQIPTADNLGMGVAPSSRLPADSTQCKACSDLCSYVLRTPDKIFNEAMGRAGLGGSTPG